MSILIKPIFAFRDNFIWAVIDPKKQLVVVVDPGDPKPVEIFLNHFSYSLEGVLITHKHPDHTGGIKPLLKKSPVPVYGPKCAALPEITHTVSGGDKITLDTLDLAFDVMDIPGHTLEHIAFYTKGILFSGDTLFTGGCGRVFEGTYQQMLDSLKSLMALPKETLVYCGHEYTYKNLQFAKAVEPNNPALLHRMSLIEKDLQINKPMVPASLDIEQQTNPFLRCHERTIIDAVEKHTGLKLKEEVDVFKYLRKWKDDFAA